MLVTVGALLFSGTQRAQARPLYCKAFLAEYSSKVPEAKAAKCFICHVGKNKKNRNDYGKAIGKATGKNCKDRQKVKKALQEAAKEPSVRPARTFGDLIAEGKLRCRFRKKTRTDSHRTRAGWTQDWGASSRLTRIGLEWQTTSPSPGRVSWIEPPVLVLSDLHLGHPASYLGDPAALEPLLDRVRTVVFNGDTAELLNLCHRDRARSLARQLAEVCLRNGARPVFVCGNHDPAASSAQYLDLFAGRVFLTHGDVLHPRIAPWSSTAKLLWAERQRLLAGRAEPQTLDGLLLLAKRSVLVAAQESIGHREGPAGPAGTAQQICLPALAHSHHPALLGQCGALLPRAASAVPA